MTHPADGLRPGLAGASLDGAVGAAAVRRSGPSRRSRPPAPTPAAHLSTAAARALALRAQGFGASPATPDRPIAVLDRLGAIQLDSVSAIARSHDLVPFSRLGPCSIPAMHQAIYAGRQGFEYWGHAASWLPMAEYRFFRFRMARFWDSWEEFRASHGDLLSEVLDRIRAEGPLGSAAFEDPRPRRGSWWDRKPAKRALEVLFASGRLMCASRTNGFARLYDLPERVLPPALDTTDPGPQAAAIYLLRRAVGALGISTAPEAADYFRLRPADWRPALAELLQTGDVLPVAVEGWPALGLVLPAALAGPLDAPAHLPALLSPFDNLIWERGRTERLFDFRFRLELYVPEAQRPFGYYVLPLLAQGQLVGRADVKLERRQKQLRVRRLRLEGATPEVAAAALRQLATHLEADSIAVERVEPERLAGVVQRLTG